MISLNGINYQIDFNRLVFDLLPRKLRKIKVFQYLTSALEPAKILNKDLRNYISDTRYQMSVTSETMVLERHLRNLYQSEEINIINTSTVFQQVYFYRKSEVGDSTNLNNYLFRKSETVSEDDQIYLFRKSESILDYDFKVQIPSSLIIAGVTVKQVEAIVNQFKAMGTVFVIEVI